MNNNENASELPKYVAKLGQTYAPELISGNVSNQGIVAGIKYYDLQESLRKIKIFSDILQTRSFTKKQGFL
jgi:hypothetical protein